MPGQCIQNPLKAGLDVAGAGGTDLRVQTASMVILIQIDFDLLLLPSSLGGSSCYC
jgi:hypothetical protein